MSENFIRVSIFVFLDTYTIPLFLLILRVPWEKKVAKEAERISLEQAFHYSNEKYQLQPKHCFSDVDTGLFKHWYVSCDLFVYTQFQKQVN